MRFFAPSCFHQSVHSGPIRDVHGLFYLFLLFYRVIALIKQLPGSLETRESLYFTLIMTRWNVLPIAHAEGHAGELEQPKRRCDGRLRDVRSVHQYLMVSLLQVDLREVGAPC